MRGTRSLYAKAEQWASFPETPPALRTQHVLSIMIAPVSNMPVSELSKEGLAVFCAMCWPLKSLMLGGQRGRQRWHSNMYSRHLTAIRSDRPVSPQAAWLLSAAKGCSSFPIPGSTRQLAKRRERGLPGVREGCKRTPGLGSAAPRVLGSLAS